MVRPWVTAFCLMTAAQAIADSSAVVAGTAHTDPACWDAPRLYHTGPAPAELANRVHLIDVPASAPVLGAPTAAPNQAYQFWVRNPDTSQPGPWGAGVVVDVERERRPVLLLDDVAGPVAPRWINEKLIYLRVPWGRVVFSDLILDVERAELIFHEQVRYGDSAYAQAQQACAGSCPCDPTAVLTALPADMPVALPNEHAMIGLVTLPTIFAPAESGGVAVAARPVPVPVYAAPKAGAVKLGEPGAPDDFEVREYTYEGGAVVAYEQRPGWYRIGLSEGRQVWLSAKSAGEFFAIERLLVRRLAYLNRQWDGYTWASPVTYERSGLSPLKTDRDATAADEIPARILESRRIGEGLWLLVETLDRSPCNGATPRVVDRGWIPAYAGDGSLVAGYHARGC